MYKYLGFFKNGFKDSLIYRTHFITGIIASIFSLIATWFIWTAVYNSSLTPLISGFTLHEMISYMAIIVVSNIFIHNDVEYFLQHDVKKGEITGILIKPLIYPFYILNEIAGEKVSEIFGKILPIGIVAVYFLNIAGPATWLVLISFILAFMINFLISFLVGCWAFWSKGGIWGVAFSKRIILALFSGSLIPLALFPEILQKIASILPFQAIYSAPVLMYLGKINGVGIFETLGIQLLWLILLIGISYFVWKRAKKRIFIQGG